MAKLKKLDFYARGEAYGKPPYVDLEFHEGAGSYIVRMSPKDARRLAVEIQSAADQSDGT